MCSDNYHIMFIPVKDDIVVETEPRLKVKNNKFSSRLHTYTKIAGRKKERYKIEPRISVPFMLELEYESKIIF